MFAKTGVFNDLELRARNEVKWETYTKKIQIEARVLGDLALNHIIPVAIRYQSILIDNASKIRGIFPEGRAAELSAGDTRAIEKLAGHIETIRQGVQDMVNARKDANKIENEREKAIAYHDTVVPQMEKIRYHIDKVELMVDDEMWPLPKYREMLFIR